MSDDATGSRAASYLPIPLWVFTFILGVFVGMAVIGWVQGA